VIASAEVQIYVVCVALSSLAWMGFILWHSYPPRRRGALAEERPLLSSTLSAMWRVSVVDMAMMTGIIIVYLCRDYFGLTHILDVGPWWLGYIFLAQYAMLTILAIIPSTVLYVMVAGMERVDQAKYQRMLRVQEAAVKGVPPEDLRKDSQQSGGAVDREGA
jgi:hypothetical protein